MTDQERDPGQLLGELAEAYIGSRCLHVAVNLGVPDEVTDAPRRLADVAGALGADPGGLSRVLRHLVSLGIFQSSGEEIWHNDASRLLRADHPGGLAPLVELLALPVIWDSVGRLEDAARTGRPGTTFVEPDGFFAYLDRHPAESEVYDRGMTAMTTRRIDRMVPRYDFSPFDVIADIGGGRGHLLRAVLEQTPGASGVLFDRAQVVADVPPDPRITVRAGSFLTDPLPAADCYLLSNIVHDWSDDDAATILRAVRQAASASSTLLLLEFVVPEEAGDFDATDIDVSMLALVGGRERTLAEYAALLQDAGWEIRRTVPTPVHTIIEARPLDRDGTATVSGSPAG